MKIINRLTCTLTLAVALVSCTKNELNITSATAVDNSSNAQVKVFFASAYKTSLSHQISINDVRVSNVLVTGTPTPFPGGGLNTGGSSAADYLSIKAGSTKFTFGIPNRNLNTDSVVLGTNTSTLDAGKLYTLYSTDTAANMNFVLVEDSLARPDSGYTKFKFVNLIPDQTALDLYIGTVKVASNIAYKGVSPSFTVRTDNSSTSWTIKAAGGSTNIGVAYTSATTLSNQRVMTVVARGFSKVTTPSSDPRYPKVSFIFNK
jgi:hypothetical protein